MKEIIEKEFESLFIRFPQLTVCRDSIWYAHELMSQCLHNNGLFMTCGNGGSAADAEHIVGELMKEFKLKRKLTADQQLVFNSALFQNGKYLSENIQPAIPAISLVSQTSLSSAYINDVAADMVFAQQVFAYGKPNDLLIGLSTSGNSKNVVYACNVAKCIGVKTIGFTGMKESMLLEVCDITIRVPACETFCVQEYHMPVYHTLCAMLELEAFYSFDQGKLKN
jgi:D-sedoheptulose 7-phosphate isomerase